MRVDLKYAWQCAGTTAAVLSFAQITGPSYAQVLSILHNFNSIADGTKPQTGLAQAADGTLYGTTTQGGSHALGSFFKVTPDNHFHTIYSFDDSSNAPSGPLVIGTDGAIYGTTSYNSQGSVFRITPDGVKGVLHTFTGDGSVSDVASPAAGLEYNSSDGNFYGTASQGGANNGGTIFRISPTGSYSAIASLTPDTGTIPQGGLFYNPSDGFLYGTTTQGGTNDRGTVFKISSSGSLTVIQNLDRSTGFDNTTSGRLMLAADSNLYGTLNAGGDAGKGTIFKISGGVFSKIYDFHGADGRTPKTRLVQAADGNLYGTAALGGAYGFGSVFRLILGATASIKTIHSFTGTGDGSEPGDLTLGANGLLYGTSYTGGSKGFGSVFNITTNGSFFIIQDLNQGFHDGIMPNSGLFLAKDGNFYGTTYSVNSSDSSANGTIYKMTPQGDFHVLYNFTKGSSPGWYPVGNLAQSADGTFYGVTILDGSRNSNGRVYKAIISGHSTTADVTLLHQFDGTHGRLPAGGLLIGSNGNLYGMTMQGGTNNLGTLFQLTPSGEYTVLWNFTEADGYIKSAPFFGLGSLIQGSDGDLYGVLPLGGAHNSGSVFRITTGGSVVWNTPMPVGTQGLLSGLTLGADGNFYGVANSSGTNGVGFIYNVTTDGILKVKYIFDTSHAYNPGGALVLSSDGSLYGIAESGGPLRHGALFRYTPDGVTFPLYFTEATGFYYNTEGGDLLTAMPDGSIYGTAPRDGANLSGTVYRYGFLPPTIASITPASGKIGTSVNIVGTNFTKTSVVKFNGVLAPASTVILPTLIKTTVPAGATTGQIKVTTQIGSVVSATVFTVLPAITAIAPVSGPVGTLVTITGTGFNGVTSVKFNGLAAAFTVKSSTTITATVPAGATTGAISVTTAGGSAGSATAFTVTLPMPAITAFSPTSGKAETLVSISGANFTGAIAVKFNGVATTAFTVISPTKITVTVPAHATTGIISIKTGNGTAASTAKFTVTPG